MRETPDDIQRLQRLLAQSIEKAGPFLRSSFEMPTHSLSAQQLITRMNGIQTVAFSTVTATNQPRVAPIGSVFYRGQFHIPTVMAAARTRHVSRRPAVSLTWFEGNDAAVIVHGHAIVIDEAHPDFSILEELHRTSGSSSVRDWGDGAFIRVVADVIYTYARYPEQFPAN